MAVAQASPTIYVLDLVSFGDGLDNRGLILPDTDPHPVDTFIRILRFDGSVITKMAREIDVVDRRSIYPGQIVASASNLGSQLGVVTGVTTLLDLVKLNGREELTKIIRGVSPCDLQRVRRLNLGDFVVSGPWLGRVVEVFVDIDVLFEDGAVCKLSDAEFATVNIGAENGTDYRPKMNSPFYPGQSMSGDSRAVFRACRWLRGRWNPGREGGVVNKVHVSGALVSWIASAHYGTDEQLVESSAPPAYQNADNLTFVCAAFDCSWGVADRCYFRAPTSTETGHGEGDAAPATSAHGLQGPSSDMDDDDHRVPLPPRKKEDRLYGKQRRKVVFNGNRRRRSQCREAKRPVVELEVPMIVVNTRTSVDVLWQDGTVQHSRPSASVAPFEFVNDQEFFPGQRVVDNAPSSAHGLADGGTESTRRAGVVRNMCYSDQTARVSWLNNAPQPQEAREIECNCTVESTYDLERDPDESAYYGDVVVRLPSARSASGGGTPVQPPAAQGNNMKNAAADLSWVGRVVDLPDDGLVRVNWGDGSTTTVSHREISVVHEESYGELHDEMGVWVKDDGSIDATEEPVAANTDNHPWDTADAGTEDMSAAVTRINEAEEEEEEEEEVVGDDSNREEKKDPNVISSDDGSFCFPHFGVITRSPSDHYYLDNSNQDGTCAKSWVKAVQKEWQILDNNLPETIYVQAFEDRMDLLRVVILGASGTPYSDGLFFFDLQLPPSYPAVPPHVYYHSFGLSLNPNLYASGTVCLSLLSTFEGQGTEVWLPATSSLLQVVVSIQGLVLNEQPYYNEAGYETLVGTPEGRRSALPYSENAYLLTLRSMLHLLRRPPRGFEELVKDHFRRRGRFVLTACEEYLQGGDARVKENACSAGLRLALANLVPSLVAAFRGIGAEGCSELE